jgi:hypothetical protein
MPAAARKTPDTPPNLAATVPELLEVIEQKDQIIAEQQKLLRLMEEQLRLARQRRFGASSEKQPFQGDFFDEAELEVALSETEAQLPDEAPSKPRRKRREGFAETLPRIRIDLSLSD